MGGEGEIPVEDEEEVMGLLSQRLPESGRRRRQRRMASWVTAIRVTFSVKCDAFLV